MRDGSLTEYRAMRGVDLDKEKRVAVITGGAQGIGRRTAEVLADRACLSPRHFSRRFKAAFGSTPADFVENLRLTEARERLTLPDQTIESVAFSVGFKSADAFRRAFERRYGLRPTSYRKHFSFRKNGKLSES